MLGYQMQCCWLNIMKCNSTYNDDIVERLIRIHSAVPKRDNERGMDNPASSKVPYRIYKSENNKAIELIEFIQTIETASGEKTVKEYLSMQTGDIPTAYAADLKGRAGFKPYTCKQDGMEEFVNCNNVNFRIN